MSSPQPASIDPQLQTLLDFSKPCNVELLDRAVGAFFEGNTQIQDVLVRFQQHPQAWLQVDAILARSKLVQCKILAIKTLENTVKVRWKVLTQKQKDEIKKFILRLVISLSSKDPPTDAAAQKEQDQIVQPLNLVLIEVVKHEWPQNWPNFIKDLVNSSKTNQNLCANNMQILKLLSEEVFDYSKGHMTQDKMKEMKGSLTQEFESIYRLSQYILDQSKNMRLLRITLQTLDRFLHWIPIGFVFETRLVPTLLKFFKVAQFRNDALRCLSEIGGLNLDENPAWQTKIVELFVNVMQDVAQMLGRVDIKTTYNPPASQHVPHEARVTRQEFFRHLSLFIASFIKSHLKVVEAHQDPNTRKALFTSLSLMLNISEVDDVVIFKITLEMWNHLVQDLYNHQRVSAPTVSIQSSLAPKSPRVIFYADILVSLRKVLISKMAKPEEVLIVEDEHGNIVREELPDTDAKILYKNMRECLIYLTHLDQNNTQDIMVQRLAGQVGFQEYSWHNLNTLCWAIGSISGAMDEDKEKTFLVRVIKDLLGLCEKKQGKDHKAVIASNIMYVVGQYPRFLKQHWRFLKTVVTKQFEFMHEKHPGVQDMACDTFLKIAKKCKKKFVLMEDKEPRPFVEEILEGLRETTKDLEEGQIHTFYEAVGEIIQAQTDPVKQQKLIVKLMEPPNVSWSSIIRKANQNFNIMLDMKTVKEIVMVLKLNNRVAAAVGPGYTVQMSRLYLELLQVYKMYSGYVSGKFRDEGEASSNNGLLKQMRAANANALRLIQTFISNCKQSDLAMIDKTFLPELEFPVLAQYKTNVPLAKDYEVLNLYAVVVNRLGRGMVPRIGKVFEYVFLPTQQMISSDSTAFPEHRLAFIKFLRAVNQHCFLALLRLNQQQFQLVVKSIVLSMESVERKVMETGLQLMLELIKNFSEKKNGEANDSAESAQCRENFFKLYLVPVIKELVQVMTDTFHKPGFSLQCLILSQIFNIVETNKITTPLWNQGTFPNNQTYIRNYVINLLGSAFKHVSPTRIQQFTNGLFQLHSQPLAFKLHVRDFLITLNEFSASNNADFYLEEQEKKQMAEKERQRMVPGLEYHVTPSRTGMNRRDVSELL
eukprot:gb/GEZN01000638.1/.p1 GENE.gb/GEZN01000638.1/~~gb/GEZN01000638.1/.p1  ORF type:complete len:1101 (+),score=210.04 gb/GEZN01000638.1/:212-3514(+)